MNTFYLRTGLFLAVLFTAIAFSLQPDFQCIVSEPLVLAKTGDLHVYNSWETTNYLDRPKTELPAFPCCLDPDYEKRNRCGRIQLNRYLNEHLNKRTTSTRKGRVEIAYTIDVHGKMSEAELANDADPVLAGETMRLIGLMQGQNIRWYPGKIDGKLAKMKVLLQVSYGLRCESCGGLDEEMSMTWVPEL